MDGELNGRRPGAGGFDSVVDGNRFQDNVGAVRGRVRSAHGRCAIMENGRLAVHGPVPKFLGVLNQPVFDNSQRSRFDLRLRAWG